MELIETIVLPIGFTSALITIGGAFITVYNWRKKKFEAIRTEAEYYENILNSLSKTHTKWNVAASGLHEVLEQARHKERLIHNTAAFMLMGALLMFLLSHQLAKGSGYMALLFVVLGSIYALLSFASMFFIAPYISKTVQRFEAVFTSSIKQQLDSLDKSKKGGK